ncbi:hypothetical protein BDZ85DRAFT_38537 [Elsinoe ampelina]|uniref:Uncharacterized protein n=1 Tax=Elsinoe ampelina TaxID=302913 RepID=A0A6A6G1K7_9PEZI|nr:hypothetical protein BDZ85DRAFT_38537 [Elsinoe ampelina]
MHRRGPMQDLEVDPTVYPDFSSQPDLQRSMKDILDDITDDVRAAYHKALRDGATRLPVADRVLPTNEHDVLPDNQLRLTMPSSMQVVPPPNWHWRAPQRAALWQAWIDFGRAGLLLALLELDDVMQLGGKGPWSKEMSLGDYFRMGLDILCCIDDGFISAMINDDISSWFKDPQHVADLPPNPVPAPNSGNDIQCIIYSFRISGPDELPPSYSDLYNVLDDLDIYLRDLTDRGSNVTRPYRPRQDQSTIAVVASIDSALKPEAWDVNRSITPTLSERR